MKVAGLFKKKLGIVTLSLLLVFCWVNHAAAQDTSKQNTDKWEYALTLYGWYTDIDGTVNHPTDSVILGGPFKYDASDIIDDLSMLFMGVFEVHKNKWSFLTDVIYLDVGSDKTTTVTGKHGLQYTTSTSLDIASWIVSGAVAYDVVQDDWGTLAVVGGLRYTTVDIDSSLDFHALMDRTSQISKSEDVLDGIVGLRGFINLSKNWYIPYYADIGTGGSDLTWQAVTGIGYRFSWGDIKLIYRYLDYQMDDGSLLEDLNVSGAALGVTFRF
ncbi:MAG: hypothetical protein OQK71_03180 [Desulfobacter sp.]|nr:hypothetical protein [Desulfobacter sp.]